ncbi:MAG: ATPase domain-containing protein [Candidatus Bathyarchaeia archaeon]
MLDKVSTGCSSLDKLLEGGLPSDGIVLIYGEAETGKSSLAIQCAINCARSGFKTIFIDSDSTFSSKRLSQIAHHDYEKISPLIILIKLNTFQEQVHALDHLENYITKKVGLLVIDTITSLYRAELGNQKETFALNRELNRQIAYLAEVATSHKVPTLITSQVRSILLKDRIEVEPVATRVLKFWAAIVLHLKPTGKTHTIKAILEKHPMRKRRPSCYLTISKTGICDYERSLSTKMDG